MTDTAIAQLRRVTRLVAELSSNETHSLDAIASRLGVSREVIVKDLTAITERDDEPGGFVEGVSVVWDAKEVSATTSHFLRPMRLSKRELCALELGLAVLRRERTPDEHRVIDGVIEKLRKAITRVPGDERWEGVQHVELGAVDEPHLRFVRAAVEECRKLRVIYRTGAAAVETTVRTLHPYGVVFGRGHWYVLAWCERRAEVRSFRLDRIEFAELLDDRFERQKGFSVDGLFEGDKVIGSGASERLQVRYSPRIAPWIAEREGKTLAADGSLTMDHPLADRTWALRHVLQYGPEAEVLEPESLRAEVAERLGQMLA